MRLRLPLPPSVNLYWKSWRGRIVKTDEAKRYQQGVRLRALTAGVRPLEGDVVVTISIFRKARRGDVDNFLKLALDSLKGVAFNDDRQVVEIHARRYEDPADPRLEVSVEPEGGAANDDREAE